MKTQFKKTNNLQNSTILKNSNFLNSQNYILWNSEKNYTSFVFNTINLLKDIANDYFFSFLYYVSIILFFVLQTSTFNILQFILYIFIFIPSITYFVILIFYTIFSVNKEFDTKLKNRIYNIIFSPLIYLYNLLIHRKNNIILTNNSFLNTKEIFYNKASKWNSNLIDIALFIPILIFLFLPVYFFQKKVLFLENFYIQIFIFYFLFSIYILIKTYNNYYISYIKRNLRNKKLNLSNLILFIIFSPLIFLNFFRLKMSKKNLKIYKKSIWKWILNWFDYITEDSASSFNYNIYKE